MSTVDSAVCTWCAGAEWFCSEDRWPLLRLPVPHKVDNHKELPGRRRRARPHQRIVVGVDESPESAVALHRAAHEARRRHSPLHLVHAWAWSPHPPASVPEATGQRRRASQVVAAAATRLSEILPAGYATTETIEDRRRPPS
ncbi:universal stress protein [Streptomyces longispororuber]|uniref:universal stress protein n=1 Tax=Streptomyces longispororuber TaxID=68230 RepID=UPI0027E21BBD|nr:universal stress protein [Streptomyces longispororuber]